jgi:hypothetical protein
MPGGLRPLSLVDKQKKERASRTIDIAYPPRKLYRTIGNVTFSILPTPNTVIYVLEKEIAPIVAARLANLETVNEIFNLDIRANAILINEFSDAVSLEEILVLRENRWFDPEHCKMLATDVGTPHYSSMQY